jgi:hypothetical protein
MSAFCCLSVASSHSRCSHCTVPDERRSSKAMAKAVASGSAAIRFATSRRSSLTSTRRVVRPGACRSTVTRLGISRDAVTTTPRSTSNSFGSVRHDDETGGDGNRAGDVSKNRRSAPRHDRRHQQSRQRRDISIDRAAGIGATRDQIASGVQRPAARLTDDGARSIRHHDRIPAGAAPGRLASPGQPVGPPSRPSWIA